MTDTLQLKLAGETSLEDGVTVRWHGVPLARVGDDLDNPHGLARVSLGDGHVQMLAQGLLIVASGQRVYRCCYDGYMVDRRTGFRVAWRGKGWPVLRTDTSSPTFIFTGDDCEVIMGPNYVATTGELGDGQLLIDCRPVRSVANRIRRATDFGAQHRDGLLLWELQQPLAWPPAHGREY